LNSVLGFVSDHSTPAQIDTRIRLVSTRGNAQRITPALGFISTRYVVSHLGFTSSRFVSRHRSAPLVFIPAHFSATAQHVSDSHRLTARRNTTHRLSTSPQLMSPRITTDRLSASIHNKLDSVHRGSSLGFIAAQRASHQLTPPRDNSRIHIGAHQRNTYLGFTSPRHSSLRFTTQLEFATTHFETTHHAARHVSNSSHNTATHTITSHVATRIRLGSFTYQGVPYSQYSNSSRATPAQLASKRGTSLRLSSSSF